MKKFIAFSICAIALAISAGAVSPYLQIQKEASNTVDSMTATIEEIPYDLLKKITDRITKEVENVNRVLYDLTPKPSGTIEWE